MASHVFCRDLCLERGEPHEGTGDAPERALLLAWPRAKWRTPRWESVDMSAALAASIHRAALAQVHVALIDRVGDSQSLPQLMAQPEAVSADFASEQALIDAIDAYVDGAPFPGTPDPRTVIVVCTDSRRDACCARFGFSTYKALVAIADPSRFHIVQATHIGGCRFAASVIVLPNRQRYGRLTADDAPAFLEALSRGAIYLPAYKGRADLPEPAQVAELAALRWAADRQKPANALRLNTAKMPETARDGDQLQFSADLGEDRLDILLRARMFHIQGNCGVVAEGGGSHELRWCLEQLSQAS